MREYIPLYRKSLWDAKRDHERELWKASERCNRDCARAIEKAIADNHDGYFLSDCAQGVVDEYGIERVLYVLAYTAYRKDFDGRISQANKELAKTYSFTEDGVHRDYEVESHPGLTNLFMNEVRGICKRMADEMFEQPEQSEDSLSDSADDPTEDNGMGGIT